MYRPGRKNVYSSKVTTVDLHIENKTRDIFAKNLMEIPYLMYKVEDLEGGREIVINKPGGKMSYGRVSRQDFMVWIRDKRNNMLWLISHKDIFQDIGEKIKEDKEKAYEVIDLLEKVFSGVDPNELINEAKSLTFTNGEKVELLLKAYKWIWGQEDCNYPPPRYEGREMSMKGIRELKTIV